LQARHRQEIAGLCAITSKTLVNGRSNKVVNIWSTKMMTEISSARVDRDNFTARIATGLGELDQCSGAMHRTRMCNFVSNFAHQGTSRFPDAQFAHFTPGW
jgi:hypothetical protein